jgi:hypothetical protein
MLSGKSINIVFNTFVSSLQTVVSADTQINISRSLSKMKSIFVSLDKNFGATRLTASKHWMKQFNNFWHPNAGQTVPATLTHDGDKFTHFQVQIGSKLYPE